MSLIQLRTRKLSAYATGQARKSKFAREKEAAEAKRKEEEELAAKAYEEFVAAFEGDAPSGSGGPAGSSSTSRLKSQSFVRAGAGELLHCVSEHPV